MTLKNRVWSAVLTVLDILLIFTCLLLLVRLYNNFNGLNILLTAVGIVVPILTIRPQIGTWDVGRLIILKSFVLVLVFCLFQISEPPGCTVNTALVHKLEDELASESNSFIANNSYTLYTGDSAALAGKLASHYTRAVDSLVELNKAETGACIAEYKSSLAKASQLLSAAFFEERRLRINLCNDINYILARGEYNQIDQLFSDYFIDENAEVLQFEKENVAPHRLGSLKKLMHGIVVNRLNTHIKFRLINQIARNNSENITTIGFINYN